MKNNWNVYAKNILKAELARRGINYKILREKLMEIGVSESLNSINLKINRGTFSFAFFIKAMKAIGAKKIDLEID